MPPEDPFSILHGILSQPVAETDICHQHHQYSKMRGFLSFSNRVPLRLPVHFGLALWLLLAKLFIQ